VQIRVSHSVDLCLAIHVLISLDSTALGKCTVNVCIFFTAENRAALRELEAINKLIEFIGKPEWSDLHVFAVIVLANCLEDTESMEVIILAMTIY